MAEYRMGNFSAQANDEALSDGVKDRIAAALLAVRIFLPFAMGYFFISVFRSINAVIAPALARDIGLDASGLGFATSAFFLSAVLFQLPYGILLDRYDPRRLYPVFLILGALGAVISALAQDLATLALGRGLIAFGAASSAVTSFKVYSMWFPAERLPLINGFSLAAGGLGLIAGTAPVEAALQFVDWRDIHLVVAAFVAVSALLIPLIAPAKRTENSNLTLIQQIKGLSIVLKTMVFWRSAPLLMIVVGVYAGFAALWAGPWVRDVAGLEGMEAASLLLVLAASMTASGLATGPLVALAKKCGLTPMGFTVSTAIAVVLVLVVLFLQWVPTPTAAMVIWALFGFIAPLNFVTYAALKPLFPPEVTGRLNASLTLCWMVGGFVTQNLYGAVLDLYPASDGGYAPAGHRMGMGLMLLLLLAALAWFFTAPWVARKRRRVALPGS